MKQANQSLSNIHSSLLGGTNDDLSIFQSIRFVQKPHPVPSVVDIMFPEKDPRVRCKTSQSV